MRYTSMKQLAQDALLVQSACNLSGVLLSWHEAQAFLRTVTKKQTGERLSSKEIAQHPINLLFLSKVTAMIGVECDGVGGIGDNMDVFSGAYTFAENNAEERR